MYRDWTVGVVVPAYNESGLVGQVIETMPRFVDRVYLVDDCSTDGTWAEIGQYVERVTDGGHATPQPDRGDVRGPDATADSVEPTAAATADSASASSEPTLELARDAVDGEPTEKGPGAPTGPAIVPIRHDRNRGVGGAIKTGYRRALADGMDVTAVMAGDAQMDPEQLDRLLDPVVEERAAYAKGNRLAGREHLESMSSWRLFGNAVLSFLTKVASGYWEMMDPQNGYTAISREALETVDLDGLYEEYGFANDLLVELNTAGYTIADVSMPAVYGDEQSHIEYHTFVPRLSRLLLSGFLRRLGRRYVVREFHPLVLLYALGVGGFLATTAALGVISRLRRETDAGTGDGSRATTLLLTGLYAFLAAICVGFAMTLDRSENDGTVVIDS